MTTALTAKAPSKPRTPRKTDDTKQSQLDAGFAGVGGATRRASPFVFVNP